MYLKDGQESGNNVIVNNCVVLITKLVMDLK